MAVLFSAVTLMLHDNAEVTVNTEAVTEPSADTQTVTLTAETAEKEMFGKSKVLTPAQMEEIRTKDFFDMILPGSVKFLSDHYVVGDSYRSVWVIREYPPLH